MSPSGPGRPRSPRGQGDLLRKQFLVAATELLGQVERPEQLTLRMVARAVGVSPASVYSHFADLDGLVSQVLLDQLDDLTTCVETAVQSTATPLEGLLASCLAYAWWGLEHPGHYRVVFGGRIDPVLQDRVGGPTGAVLIDRLAASLAGEAASPVDAGASLLLWTSLHGLVSLRIDKQLLDWPPYDEHVVDLVAMFTGRPRNDVMTARRLGPAAR